MATTKTASTSSTEGFTADERAAMRERAKELKAEARRGARRADGQRDLLEKVAEMPPSDRAMATRIHEIISECAPSLDPKTWYGMPAYARDGKILCFFQSAAKFQARYATFGFQDVAHLDDGTMWATSFALTELTPAAEAQIKALVEQAVG